MNGDEGNTGGWPDAVVAVAAILAIVAMCGLCLWGFR